ncbi:unnamed protein product [Pipistrellus nathusii]|uniref:Uncharacterized protein n=1 Tax=Pipistrellus nathusii TaxID=59473 RepID=A0ABN9ZRP3_PIPNA
MKSRQGGDEITLHDGAVMSRRSRQNHKGQPPKMRGQIKKKKKKKEKSYIYIEKSCDKMESRQGTMKSRLWCDGVTIGSPGCVGVDPRRLGEGPGWDAGEGPEGAELTRLLPRAAKSSPSERAAPGAWGCCSRRAVHSQRPAAVAPPPAPRSALDQSEASLLRALANSTEGR